MPVTWLHGVETIESTSATTSVTEVKTAVIAIVGTAPKGPVNKVTIVNNAKSRLENFSAARNRRRVRRNADPA